MAMTSLVAVSIVLGFTQPAPRGVAMQSKEIQLPSGLRVVIAQAPAAKRQTTFSFLPMHLASDESGRAQWSHLIEHMILRTTDPEGLHVDGVSINGETTDTYLRLETIAEPPQWKLALERHARWLQPSRFDEARLLHEQRMIEAEVRDTARRGHTGKFAVAAWNQIVIHGRNVAHVHGDVQGANPQDVWSYAQAHVRLDHRALIATIGPHPIEEVEAEITRLLGDAPVPNPGNVAANPEGALRGQVAQTTGFWDLPTRHVMVWWPLPDDTSTTIAAATGVGRALLMSVSRRTDDAREIRSMTAHAIVRTPRGPCSLVNLCVTSDCDTTAIVRTLLEDIRMLSQGDAAAKQAIATGAMIAANEIMIEPDFPSLANVLPVQLRDAVEGVWLLGIVNCEWAWGVPAREARLKLMVMDEHSLERAASILRGDARVLLLEPETQDGP